MLTTAILKCVLLAKFHVEVVQTPLTEYETATISQVYNGALFEAIVYEGRINSVMIEIPSIEAKTMSYPMKDYNQRSLSTNLEVRNERASMDCEII